MTDTQMPLFPLDSDDTARPAFRVGDINPTLTAAHARGEKVAEAFRVATTGWSDHETYGAAVEALTAAGLHLCLVYPPDTLPGNEKTPVSRRHCLTTEQQTSSDYTAHGRNLDAVHLATDDPQRIAEMTAEFLRHYPGKLPNLGVHLHPSRLIVADYDTPTQTAAFDNARRFGDRDAHADHPGPTVTTPGKRDDSGAWTHSDGGHSYYVLPDGIDGDNADVPINGSTEKWAILGGPGKYVMLPGSRRTEGPYEYTGTPIDVAGPWLTRKLARPTRSARSTGARGVRTASPTMSGSGGDTPLDHWSRAHPWHELLTADGWTDTGPSGCGSHCTQWQHPDASSPRSAITHGDGCTEGYTPGDDGAFPLYMFSGSHPTLEAGRAYTRAQYALTARYGGDWATFHREEDTASYEDPATHTAAGALMRSLSSSVPAVGTPTPPTTVSPAAVPTASTSDPSTSTSPVLPTEFVTGGDAILRAPSVPPAWWGEGSLVLAARGEALMLCGTSGLGKTTIAAQLVRASIGLDTHVLGQPVVPARRVLVLAMDRPQQITRAYGRIFTEPDHPTMQERLILRFGPPSVDIAQNPEELLNVCYAAGLKAGDRLIVDSIKDAAIGLSEDAVGAGYNRARQIVLAAGIDMLELHHMTKRSGDGSGTPPKSLADVFGSAWLTNGAGSVLVLTGDAGDTYVTLSHLKQPMYEFGPHTLRHDHDTGRTTIDGATDVTEIVRTAGVMGVTAKDVAVVMFGTSVPTRNQVDKARRKLAALTTKGVLLEHKGAPGGGGGGGRSPSTWTVALAAVPGGGTTSK
ncbi:bifunctional DNA primase/polymerase [Rhodococcus sp. LW-XY12]|uniref:bifunctional DNA primase/polymerase n=1 Tax=Rhodococcus sp. LW-XY12 TaxID=2856851 RepID=UPI001C575FAE|nr:bifunctional DNA primase/polymerase [Rhodococcus sp. LW-XY12]QXU52168.1 AAA family ATPase [Rhodococcus sp. LW-XY12]